MRHTPRPYQTQADREIRDAFVRGIRRVVLVAPTGSGKTVMASAIIEGAVAKGNNVLFLAHRKELIEQCSKTLDDIGVDHGVIKSGHWRKRGGLPVQVASVQTLASRRKCKPCDGKKAQEGELACTYCGGTGRTLRDLPPGIRVVIIDECHRSLAPVYKAVLDRLPGDVLVLGLTATPWRLDGRGLDEFYQHIVATVQAQELVDQGHLLPLRVYAPDKPDLGNVARNRYGEYDRDGLSVVMRQDHLVGNVVQKWIELSELRQTVVFATSVEHSQDLVRRFVEHGVRAEHLDGNTPDTERDAILQRLASGETTVVCNVDVLVEGYDLPQLGCVVLARPTESLTRYLQMVGRAMRPYDLMEYAIIIDHTGCVYPHPYGHGLPTDPRRWSLEPRRKKDGGGEVSDTCPTVACERCGVIRPHNVPVCPACAGVQCQIFTGLPAEVDGDLVEVKSTFQCEHCDSSNVRASPWNEVEIKIVCRDCGKTSYDVDATAAHQASEDLRRREWRRLEQLRLMKRFKDGWTAHAYKRLFGAWPSREWTLENTR